ncbi:DUF7124 domain-containing protein [Halalkalicoccus jeotgali]|uniref:DUF7124 domain-containing protein n=1 Tax=Halalkalicoccus jeotgali (strain DSM 18796 / CECT 7217 / JCM 14584 / KCTC 4019 / B3) TaxID=795797 RepID=D8J9A7_HALJB|nr:hypothetical protein [Halalkalicoccus jeotgali]ADJ16376.1 hypothetical protein HacjB3_14985 [Halalkalicoccus jeotgali B3]ELY37110.1 hypothetical protein C497_10213 [Halalkalicoccus jeotgali B3]
MTDSIDLDEIETESADEPRPNRGDWFWRGEGDFEDETEALGTDAGPDASADDGEPAPELRTVSESSGPEGTTPHVPHENRDKPVGLPEERGGAGGTSAREAAREHDTTGDAPEASGPHGGGADEMTMALTYEAAKRLADPGYVLATATFADWIGIVGGVDAHVITAFQRSHGVDADFFNGTGTGPAERLAEITEMSMFFAERMVVLGCNGEEWIAQQAGWEFVPIETAAEKAGWDLD